MEFCEKIKKIRTDNNLTQEQFAEKLFVSRTSGVYLPCDTAGSDGQLLEP